MSIYYHLATLLAALAVTALGTTCNNSVAEGDTCGTHVDESGIDSVEVHLLQKDMKVSLQPAAVQEKAGVSKSVAIFVSGSLAKYQPDSSATHLVSPMVQEGYQVDYYIHLNTGAFKGWSGDSNESVMDQSLQGPEGHQLEQAITRPLANAGATVRKIILTQEESVKSSKEEQAFEDGTSDLGSRLWACCSDRSPIARRNFLRRQRGLERLWTEATALEERKGNQYELVISLVDDAVWVHDFEPAELLASQGLPTELLASQGLYTRAGWRAYSLSCGPGSTFPQGPRMYNDYIFILERQAAVPFMTTYSLMIKPQAFPEYVVNSESFYYWLSGHYNVLMHSAPAAKIPFQRVSKSEGQPQCYHKLCKSPDSDNSNLFSSMSRC